MLPTNEIKAQLHRVQPRADHHLPAQHLSAAHEANPGGQEQLRTTSSASHPEAQLAVCPTGQRCNAGPQRVVSP